MNNEKPRLRDLVDLAEKELTPEEEKEVDLMLLDYCYFIPERRQEMRALVLDVIRAESRLKQKKWTDELIETGDD